jgi:putative Mg2+ transporter-C (MgtC) family protein
VLGLLFGGGQLRLGCAATALAIFILWGLKHAENFIPREQQGNLCLMLDASSPGEEELRTIILKAGCEFTRWRATYNPPDTLSALECTVRWRERASREPRTPAAIEHLRRLPGIRSLTWQQ